MRAICVDDEVLILNMTVSLCRELPQLTEVVGFSHAREALSWLETNTADVALLDIDMPDMDGLTLAARVKELRPDTAIIFVTGYAQYAVDAFALHASGYLLKPIGRERLLSEIDYALSNRKADVPARVAARTFGTFELLVNGTPVQFSRSKSKELLAYLIDRRGSGVTRSQAFAVLWEDAPYDRSKQKQLDTIIRAMRATLDEQGVGDIFQMQSGSMRVCPEKLDCDLYRFLDGDIDAVNAYRGEYMSSYSWASLTEAYLYQLH